MCVRYEIHVYALSWSHDCQEYEKVCSWSTTKFKPGRRWSTWWEPRQVAIYGSEENQNWRPGAAYAIGELPVGTISTFGLMLVFDNGPEMRGKLTSSPATVGPSPEKVTFQPPLWGYFHAWASYFRIYFLCWPAHIETSPRDNLIWGVCW